MNSTPSLWKEEKEKEKEKEKGVFPTPQNKDKDKDTFPPPMPCKERPYGEAIIAKAIIAQGYRKH